MRQVQWTFAEIASEAGYRAGPDGKLNMPATQETADKLAAVCNDLLGAWQPGDEQATVTLTGPGPVWGYLVIAHALHGRCAKLVYAAPNAPGITVFAHGVPAV